MLKVGCFCIALWDSWNTDRLIAFQELVGLHWSIQAGLAHINVTVQWERREERQQGPWVQVVVIVDVTQPPAPTETETGTSVFSYLAVSAAFPGAHNNGGRFKLDHSLAFLGH